MSNLKLAKPKNKNSTTFLPLLGKKLSGRTFRPESANEARDVSNPNFGYNFGDVQVENGRFKQFCPLSFSGPTYCPFGAACHTCAPRIQTKLKIGQSGDKYELEADRVAEQVMRISEPLVQTKRCLSCNDINEEEQIQTEPITRQIAPMVQRQEAGPEKEEEEEEEVLQTKQEPGRSPGISSNVQKQIKAMRCSGHPLPKFARNYFEPRFGHDLSHVRVHNDSKATKSARELNARAYTVGQNIVFGTDQYAPEKGEGRKLLAHELTHVVQQRYAASSHTNCGFNLDAPGSATEKEARTIGSEVAAGGSALSVKAQPVPIVSLADPDAVSRTMALGNTVGSGIQFWPTNVTDTVVGPVSVRGGLLSSKASRLNVIIGENITPRILARQLLPLWTTATPFTAPGAAAPVPLDIIDDEMLAQGLLVYNQYYIPVPAMTRWRSGLRFPLPVEIDESTGVATLHPTLIRNLAGAFDPAWAPLLDTRATATAAPPAATVTADVTAFLARETTALARGIHLGARAETNAVAELPSIREVFQQLGAAGFDVALAFMDYLVNREISLLAAQRDGAAILTEIQTALGAAPAAVTPQQQASLDRANLMLGLVAGVTAAAPPAATRTRAEKTVTVDTVKLDGSNQTPTTDVAVADAAYSQCNVRIRHGVNATATPAETTTWLGADRNLRATPTCGRISAEERRMYQGATTAYGLSAPIRAFFVRDTSASGYSFPPYCATGSARPFRGMAAIDNSGDTDTLAHELGHILINHRGHPASTLMAARPRPTLRLTDWQCNRIYRNA